MPAQNQDWFKIRNTEDISSPALLVYPDRVRSNIQRMLDTVGGDASRLCPHVKTIKTEALIGMMVLSGIKQFKCATIAEGEIAIKAGAASVLLAIQPTYPNAKRWLELAKAHPDRSFGTVIDCKETLDELSALSEQHSVPLRIWIDLNIGMNRTGIRPGPAAAELAQAIQSSSNLIFGGIHAYDGHLHQPSIAARQESCDAWHAELKTFINMLNHRGLKEVSIIAGGTPTFPMQAAKLDFICSPGTCVLWDAGYASHYSDLDFSWACVMLARVISKPSPDLLCLDLGHKAVASEMSHPRMQCLNVKVNEFVSHSEEHLVIRSSDANQFSIGDTIYAIPWHVCPTVALHQYLHVVENGQAIEQWEVAARNRMITL
jgi:D-serine deaminase-like pyridoxal phosphate-dependent protein